LEEEGAVCGLKRFKRVGIQWKLKDLALHGRRDDLRHEQPRSERGEPIRAPRDPALHFTIDPQIPH
jgi:hypothetical protein